MRLLLLMVVWGALKDNLDVPVRICGANGLHLGSVNGRKATLGLDHARELIAIWASDFNTQRPHSSFGYKTPEDFARTITATGSGAPLLNGSAPTPVAHPAPYGVAETDEALIAAG